MPRKFDRARAIRQLRLPEQADDARIVREIRKLTRIFRRTGRPLVIPRNFDLAACIAAIDQRLEDEITLEGKIMDQIRTRKEKLVIIDKRVWLLETLRDTYYAPVNSGSDDQK